jgi:hypothetical protein
MLMMFLRREETSTILNSFDHHICWWPYQLKWANWFAQYNVRNVMGTWEYMLRILKIQLKHSKHWQWSHSHGILLVNYAPSACSQGYGLSHNGPMIRPSTTKK